MCKNIQKILNGSDEIASYYQQAKLLWDEIDISDKELINKVQKIDEKLERICKDRNLGQEILVCYGIMQFIEKENPDIHSAKKIADVLSSDYFSNEIKNLAKEISKRYPL